MEMFPYTLPDQILWQDRISQYRVMVWIPSLVCIVLGNSNHISEAIFEDVVQKDCIPVMKRPTGGQTVLLSPKMIAISAIQNHTPLFSSRQYFEKYNQKIIAVLQKFAIKELTLQGISDITIQGQKIAGSAMYRNPERIFFHAIVNIAEDPILIEKYLKFPNVVPVYRKNRTHRHFITSLLEWNPVHSNFVDCNLSDWIFQLRNILQQEMEKGL